MPSPPIGLLPLIVGIAILLWCVRDFYVAGKGTLAPWDPPKHLVVVGWTLLAGSRWLAVYTGVLAIAFHLRVVLMKSLACAGNSLTNGPPTPHRYRNGSRACEPANHDCG